MDATTVDLAAALKRQAAGTYPTEAAIQLLLDTLPIERLEFAATVGASFTTGEPMAHLDWDLLVDHPWSGGEARIIAIARALHDDDLDVYGLSPHVIDAITYAIHHAAGLH